MLVVGLGEALFDRLPTGDVLGGAPLNVAAHAAALLPLLRGPLGGGRVAMATRVGVDDLGERCVLELARRVIDVAAVQRDPCHATGTVDVELGPLGDARYVFAENCAWDHLECNETWLALASTADAVAFGTLAQRSAESRAAVREFLGAASRAVRLWDANLRAPFFDAESVVASLGLATCAKLSEDELRVIGEIVGARGAEHVTLAESVRKRFDFDWLAVTRGAEGTLLVDDDGAHKAPAAALRAPRAGETPDTVGAGDAAAAGLLCGALGGWPAEKRLRLAAELGAYVASRSGATPEFDDELRAVVMRLAGGRA